MTMKTMLALALVLALPQAALAQSAVGLWRTQASEDGAFLDVRIAPCAGRPDRLCGTVQRAYNAPGSDLTGLTIIRDMAEAGPRRWNGGTIWAPDDDKTYRSKMSLVDAGLRVQGCVAIFCRSQVWMRLQ